MQLKREFALWATGSARWRRGNFYGALKCFERMSKENGSRIAFNLGVLYMVVGQVEKGIEGFLEAVSQDGYFALGHLALAKVYSSLGLMDEAKRAAINCIDSFRMVNEIDYGQLGMHKRIIKSDVLFGLQLLAKGKRAFEEFDLDELFELPSWKTEGLEKRSWLGESVEIVAAGVE
jgi:tetratricopeptide (TPR) repeat protein